MLQDETCPKCGQPVWLCRSDSNNVAFKVQSDTCFADKALKAYEDNKKDRKERAKPAEKKDWGKFFYTVPYVPPQAEGAELPSRLEYYNGVREAQ